MQKYIMYLLLCGRVASNLATYKSICYLAVAVVKDLGGA
jgi:hypothetical protein